MQSQYCLLRLCKNQSKSQGFLSECLPITCIERERERYTAYLRSRSQSRLDEPQPNDKVTKNHVPPKNRGSGQKFAFRSGSFFAEFVDFLRLLRMDPALQR